MRRIKDEVNDDDEMEECWRWEGRIIGDEVNNEDKKEEW